MTSSGASDTSDTSDPFDSGDGSDASDGVLVVERRGHVLVLRLNRPEVRNALDGELLHALGAGLVRAETDPDVRVAVLTGTGDRAFCSGMDLRSFAGDGIAIEPGPELDAFQRLTRGEVTVPLVGAANASAVAGGLELLLGCDLIVVAEGAKLGLPEVKRGLIAGGGGTFLANRLPLGVALELALTGDSIGPGRALDLGLVNAVVPAAEVLPTAVDYAERIAANGPLAVRATKELVRLGASDAAAHWARLRELQPEIFGSEDAREGAVAYIEKRPPTWQGR